VKLRLIAVSWNTKKMAIVITTKCAAHPQGDRAHRYGDEHGHETASGTARTCGAAGHVQVVRHQGHRVGPVP